MTDTDRCGFDPGVVPETPAPVVRQVQPGTRTPGRGTYAGHFVRRFPRVLSSESPVNVRCGWARIESDFPVSVSIDDGVVSIQEFKTSGIDDATFIFYGEAYTPEMIPCPPLAYEVEGPIERFSFDFRSPPSGEGYWGLVHVYFGDERIKAVGPGRRINRSTLLVAQFASGQFVYRLPFKPTLGGSVDNANELRPFEIEVTAIGLSFPFAMVGAGIACNLLELTVQDPNTGTLTLQQLATFVPECDSTFTGAGAVFAQKFKHRQTIVPARPIRMPMHAYWKRNPGDLWGPTVILSFDVDPIAVDGEEFLAFVNWYAV